MYYVLRTTHYVQFTYPPSHTPHPTSWQTTSPAAPPSPPPQGEAKYQPAGRFVVEKLFRKMSERRPALPVKNEYLALQDHQLVLAGGG